MKNLITFIFFCFFFSIAAAQPIIQWQKSLGGSHYDEARCVQQTSDGGYIIAGYTVSNNGDVIGNHGGNDFWIVKLSDTGMMQWKKSLGGSDNDWAYSIQQTNDEGYIITGFTQSEDGNVTVNHGDKDCWVVKLNSTGALQWEKTFGGSNWEEAWSVRQSFDGGYIIAGRSNSLDGDVTGNHGGFDFWVVKMTGTGVLEWQKSLGGSSNDIAYSIRQTPDGGYVVTGESNSNDGDITENQGSNDYWVVKLSSFGEIEWQKTLGSTSLDRSNDIILTVDSGYVVIGEASANNGDVTGHHGGYDFWAVKLNGIGDIQWQKAFGGSGEEFCKSIHQTNDGGYIIAGTTQSTNGDVLDNDGGQDVWLVKLNAEGEIKWQKTLGGTQAEWANSIQQTSDLGYILAGYAWSNNGDVSGVHGYNDFWIVKLSPESVGLDDPLTSNSAGQIVIYPNPAHQSISLNIPPDEPDITVQISDLLGRQLSQQAIPNGGQADVSLLPNGLYLVKATTPRGKIYSGKLSKE